MNIAVYCGSTPGNKSMFTERAKELGKWMAANGHNLVYGGSDTGLMGAVADGVLEAGGEVIGVVPDVPLIKSRIHKGITRCIYTDTMAERKTKMIELADAFIALPGGIGTFDELTEIVSLRSLDIIKGPVICFNVDGYYEPLRKVFKEIIHNGFGKPAFFDDIVYSDDFEEIGRRLSFTSK